MEATITNLGLSPPPPPETTTAAASRAHRHVDQRVTLADDPAVLLALLSDAAAQITAIATY